MVVFDSSTPASPSKYVHPPVSIQTPSEPAENGLCKQENQASCDEDVFNLLAKRTFNPLSWLNI
jgi:hypothetical protein